MGSLDESARARHAGRSVVVACWAVAACWVSARRPPAAEALWPPVGLKRGGRLPAEFRRAVSGNARFEKWRRRKIENVSPAAVHEPRRVVLAGKRKPLEGVSRFRVREGRRAQPSGKNNNAKKSVGGAGFIAPFWGARRYATSPTSDIGASPPQWWLLGRWPVLATARALPGLSSVAW